MATTKQLLNKLICLLDNLEDDLFDGRKSIIYYKGVRYTRGDWENYRRIVEKIQDTYQLGSDTSNNYLKKRPDYNRLSRQLCYYRRKKNKKPNDYAKIEMIQKKLEKVRNKYKSMGIKEKLKILTDLDKGEQERLKIENFEKYSFDILDDVSEVRDDEYFSS